jgi:hypothetical protein
MKDSGRWGGLLAVCWGRITAMYGVMPRCELSLVSPRSLSERVPSSLYGDLEQPLVMKGAPPLVRRECQITS